MRAGQFFSHQTSALLWGVPLPSAFDPGAPLHVSSIAPTRPPRTRGVIGHELTPGGVRVVRRHGLPVADAASTWLQLGTLLGVDDLVVAGDHFVLDPAVLDPAEPRPYVTLVDLAAALDAHRGRGRRALLDAAGRIRVGSESRPETLLRLLLIRAGLPEPEVNFVVEDERGRVLGRVDLAYPRHRVAVEYDGDHHRTSTRQYEHDIARFDRLHDAGWRVIRVRSRGLFRNPEATIARVRGAITAAAGHAGS